MGRRQVLVGQLRSRLVRVEGVGRACLAVVGGLELGKIPINIRPRKNDGKDRTKVCVGSGDRLEQIDSGE